MVANLPYSVATPLLLRTIAELPSLQRWTVMVQREIADRLRAAPGTAATARPASSSSSPARSSCCEPSTRPSFGPRPRVESAILALRRDGPGRRSADA